MPRKGWGIPQREATAESLYLQRPPAPDHHCSRMVRRDFLRTMSGLGIDGILSACGYEAAFKPDDAEDVYMGSAGPGRRH